MPDALSIVNLGLGKIAASRISSLNPPKSALERHCNAGYPQWRDSELEKRVWTFSLAYASLTREAAENDTAQDGRKYSYPLPTDCIRPLRDPDTEWEQRGNVLASALDRLTIAYIRRANEGEFPASFVEVLSRRIAAECVEFATQSNTKEEVAEAKYDKAVRDAGRLNAWRIGHQDVTTPDEHDEWVAARVRGF